MSQDFGENKCSKNIKVTIQIKQLCHKTLEEISTVKWQDSTYYLVQQDMNDKFWWLH